MTENLLDWDFRQELLAADKAARDMNEVSLKARDLLEHSISNGKIELQHVSRCACSSENLEPLVSIDRFGLKFGSVICADCGLVITNPRIAEKSLPYYYDQIYHPLNYGKAGLDELPHLYGAGQGQKIFNLVLDKLIPDAKLRVLEVGSGTGSVLREFIDEAGKHGLSFVSAIGTEFSEECITISKERNGGRNIEFIYGGLREILQQQGGPFDLIILSHVFEHFVELDVELERISQLLAPQALLYIEVPGIYQTHKKRDYNFSIFGHLIHAHMYNFTAASLAKILVANGFCLEYINENIEAVCRKNPEAGTPVSITHYLATNSYSSILSYLQLLARDHSYFLAQAEETQQLVQEIVHKNRQIEQKNDQIQARDVQLQQKVELIHQKHELILQRNELIHQKDESIRQKHELILQRNELIHQKDESIRQKHELILQRNELIQQKDSIIAALSAEVEEFRGLFFARAVRKISRLLSRRH